MGIFVLLPNLMKVEFNNGKFFLHPNATHLFEGLFKKNLPTEEGKVILAYLYYFYDKESPYSNLSEPERKKYIANFHLKKQNVDEKKLDRLLLKHEEGIKAYEELIITQNERVLNNLIKQIDESVKVFSEMETTIANINEKPKIIESISKMIAIKEKIVVEIKRGELQGQNRGNKTEGALEKGVI